MVHFNTRYIPISETLLQFEWNLWYFLKYFNFTERKNLFFLYLISNNKYNQLVQTSRNNSLFLVILIWSTIHKNRETHWIWISKKKKKHINILCYITIFKEYYNKYVGLFWGGGGILSLKILFWLRYMVCGVSLVNFFLDVEIIFSIFFHDYRKY